MAICSYINLFLGVFGIYRLLGSVYLLEKKSGMTFITSMVGAIVNIIMNIILIPHIGAQGASIATLISYVAVFIIRAVNTKKYMDFSLHLRRLLPNIAIISAQIALMLTLPEYILITQPLCLTAVALINFRPLIKAVREMMKKLIKR